MSLPQLVDVAFEICNGRQQRPKRRCKDIGNRSYGANVQSVEKKLTLSPIAVPVGTKVGRTGRTCERKGTG